jgi:hypothetical protein
MFHRGCLSLTLVQDLCMRFCKENDSLVNWNEIKDLFMSQLFRLSYWCLYFCSNIYFGNFCIQKIT